MQSDLNSNPNPATENPDLTVSQAATLFSQTGLIEDLDKLSEKEDAAARVPGDRIEDLERKGELPPLQVKEAPSVGASERMAQQSSPQGAPAPPSPYLPQEPQQPQPAVQPVQPVAGQPQQPQHPQSPLEVLSQIQAAHVQANAELQSIRENREQLVSTHGADAVVARETELRAHAENLQRGGRELGQQLHAAQRQQDQHYRAWINSTQAQLRDRLGVSNEEFATLKEDARQLMRDAGATEREIANLSEPRTALAMLQAAKNQRDLKRNKANLRKAARKLAKQDIRREEAEGGRYKVKYTPYGAFTPGDGSIAEAAEKFKAWGLGD